ncbi:hypothetical protein EPR50_G00154410 [Perca flavescens]|uniref:Helicase C-terminal domain-containing protein n=1 Tax=Perca flavescens TaxID=8167 RepID=A0A484CGU7_PERFV|nr:hypothetical protein EPR50_G00154410 [Perca flavescens]
MDGYAGVSPLNCPLMPAPDTPHHWLCRPASPSADVMSAQSSWSSGPDSFQLWEGFGGVARWLKGLLLSCALSSSYPCRPPRTGDGSKGAKLKIHEWSKSIQSSSGVGFVLTFVFVFSIPVTDSRHTAHPQLLPAQTSKDVEDVKFVINYDYPNSSEDYIHRIGRTARSTNKGTAYTFFTPGNLRQARDLIRVLEEARQAINPKLLQLVDTGRGAGGGGGRLRFRGSSNSNNPNLMYQDTCDRRMRTVGGGGSSAKDSRCSSYGRDSRDSRGGSSRDRERSSSSSSSHRDRSSRDGGRSYGSGSGSGSSSSSYDQYQNSSNSSSSSQYSSSRSGGGGVGQVPPSSAVPQPLMAKQFNPPQPMMGLMGHSPFQFAPPPPPPPSGRK